MVHENGVMKIRQVDAGKLPAGKEPDLEEAKVKPLTESAHDGYMLHH